MSTIQRTTKEEYVGTYIDLISALYWNQEKWLRPREREFMVHCVVIRSEGLNLKDKNAVEELVSRMGFKDHNDVYNYRNKLKKKDWIVQTTDDLLLPKAFDRFKNKIPLKTPFKFQLELHETYTSSRNS